LLLAAAVASWLYETMSYPRQTYRQLQHRTQWRWLCDIGRRSSQRICCSENARIRINAY